MTDDAEFKRLAVGAREDRYLSGWRLGIVILSLFLGAFVLSIDTSIINVAIPYISSHFKALDDVAWYGTAYLLTLTAFQPVYGNVYKFFNVKWTYVICIVTFEVGSILCAAATSSEMFIAGRVVAGLGGAGILQGNLSIIGLIVPLGKRPFYMGIVISVFIISVCIGPLLGGAFTTHGIWRWCFWINVPIGGVILILLFFFLCIRAPDNENRALPLQRKLAHMDPLGCVVFIGGICCLLLALQWGGQTKPWNSSTIIGLFIGFGLLMILFGFLQWWRKEKAMIPLRVLRQRSIMTGAGVLFFLGATCYAIAFYIPFYFQAVKGVSAVRSGIYIIADFFPQMLALIVVGAIVTQWGHYVPYMVLGEIVCIIGTVFLTKLHLDTSKTYWAAALVVHGLGMGIAMQLPYTAVQVVLHEDDVPTGNAIAVFSWQLGGAISIAIGQTLSLNTILTQIPRQIPSLSPEKVMAWGANNLPALAPSPEALLILREIWNTAVSHVLVFGLACVCAAVPFTLGMEWLNAKRIAEKRVESGSGSGSEEEKVG